MAKIEIRKIRLLLGNILQETPHVLKFLWYVFYCRLYKLTNTCYLFQGASTCYYNVVSLIFGNRQSLQWKTHWQSPVCRDILRRKYFLTRSKHALISSVYCFIISLCLFADLQHSYFSGFCGSFSETFWYVELVLCLLLVLNALFAILFYMWFMFSKPMAISPVQQKLFGINENDPGFTVKRKREDVSEVLQPKHLQFSSWRSSFNQSGSPSCLSLTPINYSYNSWASDSQGVDTTSSSFSFYRASSPVHYSSTPKVNSCEKSSSWRRLNLSDNVESIYDGPIKSKKHLEEFLKVQEEEERKKHSVSFEDSKGFMTAIDNNPMSMLSNCFYQKSYRLLHAETPEDDTSESHSGDSMLLKLKVNDKMLTCWCERVRKWICQTILVKLVREIDEINYTLSELGLAEFQIGSISSSALHQLSISKSQHLPSLPTVLPYLDTFPNQEYVVRRLKDLAHGGCIGDFKWNSGGAYEDQLLGDDLPTDPALIMHFLCCYFDAHLPPDPHCPEGKPFSSKYFKKAPEKIVLSKDLVYFHQSILNPPQFKVVMGEDVYAPPNGRNNLLYALVMFLHYIKTKQCGMLGHVNLGPSGLNILWVVDGHI